MKDYTEISKKSNATKSSTFIDGKNMHQISAERATKTTQERYTKEERSKQLSDGQNKYNQTRRALIDVRIDKCIDRYGIVKFASLLCSGGRPPQAFQYFRKYLIKRIREYRVLNLDTEFKYGLEEFYYVHIKHMQYRCVCKVCGEEFVNKNVKSKNKATCSKRCASKFAHIKNPRLREAAREFSYLRYSDPSESIKLSESLRVAHSKKTNTQQSDWSYKMLTTMGKAGILARGSAIKETRILRGQIIPDDQLDEYKRYTRQVKKITAQQNLDSLENYEHRGKFTYHLDHIYPTSAGFLNKIPPEIISDIRNLRMLPYKDNLQKSGKIEYVPQFIMDYINETNKNQ